MQRALEIDFKPLRTLPIALVDPPIQPLDPACKNTSLTWLREGAKPVGGTDCVPNLSCEGCTNFPPPLAAARQRQHEPDEDFGEPFPAERVGGTSLFAGSRARASSSRPVVSQTAHQNQRLAQ